MKTAIALITLALATAGAYAQTGSTSDPANSTGTSTSQQEMNRGVPAVDADVGRNARGAIDVDVDRNTSTRNLPGVGSNNRTGSDASTSGTGTERAARADRN